ncbi:psychosine receptor [Sceloporus undulatus]|uniref:psychosine receptor n=1 Tax=Sceloporus undulatus TaxID=8520 RepID=UPI001C4C23B9|nr:psychosine receptor [Sceloporus undulatus]XP_042300879.1 psychosine receptor [Sceloporus undulatus]
MNSTAHNDICEINHELDEYLFPVLYSILMIISIPANLASLFISCCQVKKKNELGIYLLSLSLADLLYTLTLPLWIYYAQNGDDWRLSPDLCKLSVFLKYLNYYTSSGFLTCISLDRYFAIVHPLRFHYLRTRRFALLISALVWGFEIMSNFQILKQEEIFPEHDNSKETNHTLCYDTYPLQEWQAWLNIYRVGVGYMIPLIIMVFCYQKIYRAVEHNQATQECDKRKIKHLLLSIIATFFLCFTPYHVVLFLRSIMERHNCSIAKVMFTPYRITTALTSLNCIADPILYCFVSETGRTDIWNMFKCDLSVSQPEVQKTQNFVVSRGSQYKTNNVPESATFL